MNRAQRRDARRPQRIRQPDRTAAFNTILRHQAIGDHATHNLVIAESAFQQLAAGSTDHSLFDELAMAINCGLVRAESIDPLLEATFNAAVVAMTEAMGIHARHGRYGFTGPGLGAVGDALEAYGAIARQSSPQQMKHALDEVLRRCADQRAAA